MKQVVVGVGLLLGFSGFASAESQNWFNRHDLPFHKTPKGHPGRPGGPSLGNQGNTGNSGGSGSGQSFSGGSDSNGNNSNGNNSAGGNGGGSSAGNFFTSLVGDDTPPHGGQPSGGPGGKIAAPEIDPASGASALGLLSAALLMIRGRRKKPLAA
jgi:hypothetical protein